MQHFESMTMTSPRVETFAFFCGIAYLAIGLLGFMPQPVQTPPGDTAASAALYGYLLGLLPVNAVHNAVHAAVGVWGVAAGRSFTSPKLYARIVAVAFAALALLGLAPGLESLSGFVPLHGNDVWLHAATAAIAAYFGWHPAASVERRASREADRRQRAEPVAHERRLHPDRRSPGSEV
jgi:hypothetical protein